MNAVGSVAIDDGVQNRDDDAVAQNPPPEFAAGGATLERGVFLPETGERLADGAVICRLIEWSSQCEETTGPLRLRRAVLLLVVAGGIVVLRCAVLRCAVLGHLLSVVGCVVLRCLLTVIILPVGAVAAVLRGLLRVLWIILVGVRH